MLNDLQKNSNIPFETNNTTTNLKPLETACPDRKTLNGFIGNMMSIKLISM